MFTRWYIFWLNQFTFHVVLISSSWSISKWTISNPEVPMCRRNCNPAGHAIACPHVFLGLPITGIVAGKSAYMFCLFNIEPKFNHACWFDLHWSVWNRLKFPPIPIKHIIKPSFNIIIPSFIISLSIINDGLMMVKKWSFFAHHIHECLMKNNH
jgi:hypothetical protein